MNPQQMLSASANHSAQQALHTACSVLERQTREMRLYMERLQSCENDRERAEVMNWAMNSLATGILPNLRLDLFASAQAALAAAHATRTE